MKYLLMYNPVSGKQKFHKHISFIKKYFNEKGLLLDIYRSKHQRDLEDRSFEFAGIYDVIIISGGDGTINEVINGIMNSKFRPTIATLPSGTANDVAHLLGFNKKIKRSLDIITETKPIPMDISRLNDHYFVYATAAGILTKISYTVSRKRVRKYGYLAYLGEGAKDIFKKYKMELDIDYSGGNLKGEYMLALALSSKRVAGFSLKRFSNSKLDDGNLEMRLIKSVKRFKLLKLVIFFLSGGIKRGEDIHIRSDFFKIKAGDDVAWNTDGEKSALGSVNIKVYKKELKVFASDKSKKKYFNNDN